MVVNDSVIFLLITLKDILKAEETSQIRHLSLVVVFNTVTALSDCKPVCEMSTV